MFADSKQIQQFLQETITSCRVLVVGDIMLDRYYFGEVKRISPEAPVPVTRVLSEKDTLGGAANVAHNLARLGCQTMLVGTVGEDDSKRRLCGLLAEAGIAEQGLVIATAMPTTTKLRVIGGHQQMLRLDFEETGQLSSRLAKAVCVRIESIIKQGIDAVLISDYAKGICTTGVCKYIITLCAERNIPVVVDPKGSDWRKYSGADFITPNMKEVSEAVHKTIRNEDEPVQRAAEMIRKKYRLGSAVITRSEKGLSLMDDMHTLHIPTHAQEVFDVSGAGDTVIAVLGAALAGGLPVDEAANLANLAAGIAVGKVGTYAVGRKELLEAVLQMERGCSI